MIELFDRILRIRFSDETFGTNWNPLTVEIGQDYDVVLPERKDEQRRVYVYTYDFAANGVYMKMPEAQALVREKEQIAEHIRMLGKHQSAYVYCADYCKVHLIEENGIALGYDFILRYLKPVTLEHYLQKDPAAYQELLSGTSGKDEVHRRELAATLLNRIGLALKEVHSMGTVHGNVDPEHIWLPEDMQKDTEIRLCPPQYEQFGKSYAEARDRLNSYSAPELAADREHPYTEKTDLYGLGVTLYTLLNEGKMPFWSVTNDSKQEQELRWKGEQEIPEPKYGTPLLKYLARKLLAYDPEVRPSAEELIAIFKQSHPDMPEFTTCSPQANAVPRVQLSKSAGTSPSVPLPMPNPEPVSAPSVPEPIPEPEPEPVPEPVQIPDPKPEPKPKPDPKTKQKPVTDPSPDPPPVPPPGKSCLGCLIAFLIIVILLIAAVAVWLWLQSASNSSSSAQNPISSFFSDEHTAETIYGSVDDHETWSDSQNTEEQETSVYETETAATETEPTTEAPLPHEYHFVTGKYTWEEAEQICESCGGHLATIHSEEDWNAILSAVEIGKQSQPDLKFVWLGATSYLTDEMTVIFSWVDGSETNYIMSDEAHWYYNSRIDVREPSGYDAYEYVTNGTLVREPYLLLWNIAPRGGSSSEWSLNDVPDVSGYKEYKDSNMGFVMQIN